MSRSQTDAQRYRILVIGNCGVGKSALIRRVFGIQDVDINDYARGVAYIDKELVAENDHPFVVHDSLGLEAGEDKNITEIKNFISDRQQKGTLEERLDAVWVCLAVPYAKARFLEAGLENFLKNRKDILGDIPIVIVLTKVDLLDKTHFLNVYTKGEVKNVEEAMPVLRQRRDPFLQEYCIKPLRLQAKADDLPYVAVSVESIFELDATVEELLQKTTSAIKQYRNTRRTL